MKTSLTELAKIIRSKNSGPYEITLDILLKDKRTYELFKKKMFINSKLIASIYNISENRVRKILYFDPANAIKINLKRQFPAGAPGETDVYGAQQHAPLLSLTFDLKKEEEEEEEEETPTTESRQKRKFEEIQ